MSRIGRMPVVIPSGVTVKLNDTLVTVTGPKGTLSCDIGNQVKATIDNGHVIMTRINDEKEVRAKHGLYRALVHNMVVGVTQGYEKTLVINGVGFKTQMQGKKLVMNIGYSHTVEMDTPEGITITCPSLTEIVVSGADKNLVGQTAANIRAKREVEPYHAYGIKYKDEVVVIKEGKTAGK